MKYKQTLTYWDKALQDIETGTSSGNILDIAPSFFKIQKQDTENAIIQAEAAINAVINTKPFTEKPWNAFGYCVKATELIRSAYDDKTKLKAALQAAADTKEQETEIYNKQEKLSLYCLMRFIILCKKEAVNKQKERQNAAWSHTGSWIRRKRSLSCANTVNAAQA